MIFAHSQQKIREESVRALETLRVELEAQHEAAVNQLKAVWAQEKDSEIQLQVNLEKAVWKEEVQQV